MSTNKESRHSTRLGGASWLAILPTGMLIAGIVVAQNFLNTDPEVGVQTTYGPVAGAQLARMLGTSGFDARRDILGVTVNRWPIANAESGAAAFTNVVIDQAERAIQECLSSRGMV